MQAAIAALTISTLILVAVLAGSSGIAYAVLFGVVVAPGLPLGFALFGRRHPAGWIAGLLIGYAITTFAWWTVVFVRIPSAVAFLVASLVSAACSWLAAGALRGPVLLLPPWSRRTSLGLALVLLLAPVLVSAPFIKLGSHDAAGNRLYRAYFIADFVWHTALTAELAKEEQPPRNPFAAEKPVHYYWAYFRVPATLAAHIGIDVQDALKVNAVGVSLLLLAAIYLAAWTAVPEWPLTCATAVALTVIAPSIEGLAVVADLIRRHRPLAELREINIDAAAAWQFKGLRIDDLPRTMWYTPQHGMSCALGLIGVTMAIAAGVRMRAAAIILAGVALGASLAFNPLIGSVLCFVYGATVLIDAVHSRATLRDVLRHAVAAVPVALAFGWCLLNQVGEGAGNVLHFGFWGPATHGTVEVFLLSFGPILIPIAIGLWNMHDVDSMRRLWAAFIGIGTSILLMHLVTLTVDQAWVGFRAGNLFFILAPALVASGLTSLWSAGHRQAARLVGLAVLLIGAPTTIIDVYNAQDVANLKMGPGFHWTVTVTAPEQEALDWIRTHTLRDAVVQHEPVVRGRETWSLIPTFAERRMATGNALPLLPLPDYEGRNQRVRDLYSSSDARTAWQTARDLRIDYIYVDATERARYPEVAKFDSHPQYFERVFSNSEASVYAVRP